MFEQRVYRTKSASALALAELIFHNTVRQIRKGQSSGGLGLVTTIFQKVAMILGFVALYEIMGTRHIAIRGDFMLYIMSGVFLFVTHVKTISAVFGSVSPTSPMLMHAPMNTLVIIISTALSTLYLHIVSILVILFVYNAIWTPITIEDPIGALAMLLLVWFVGVGIGMVFLAAKPWAPWLVNMLKVVYNRLNMLASGKFFVANMLSSSMLPFFDWNPLFHGIDQTRGFVFLNYNPHYTSVSYPLYVGLALIAIGLMGEFFTRQRASMSWFAT